MYTDMVFGAAEAVLFIEVSTLQGVLIRGVHCSSLYVCVLVDECRL